MWYNNLVERRFFHAMEKMFSKKLFSILLSVFTLTGNISYSPVLAEGEDAGGGSTPIPSVETSTGSETTVQSSPVPEGAENAGEIEAETTPSKSTPAPTENPVPSDEPTGEPGAEPSTEPSAEATADPVLKPSEKPEGEESPFEYEVKYDEDFSKATIMVKYTKDDAEYIDLDNADDYQALAECGTFAVNEELTSDMVLAFDVYANDSYVLKVSAVGEDSETAIASDEKTLEVTDIKSADEIVKDTPASFASEMSVKDLVEYIEQGNTLMFMIGNETDDELWKRIVAAYNQLEATVKDKTDVKFIKVNTEKGDIRLLSNLALETSDAKAIVEAYKDVTDGTTGHAVTGFVYNGAITDAVVEQGDTDEYTAEEQAAINWSAKYIHTEPASEEDGIMLIKDNTEGNPATALSKEWDFQADGNTYQEFTAPENGLYYVELWGADGDTDTGNWTKSFVSGNPPTTTGIGGQAGTVKGYIHLTKGQTIYLSLGYRNGMYGKRKYGGGGTGWGQDRGFRSGGGGAGAIYLEKVSGNGELVNYENHQDKILMVAGGGGGAEDFYTATWTGNKYYCSYNACINARGGNGGKNPTGGISTGPTAATTGYKFGLGEDYNSWDNSSSGGGGAGLMGGRATDGSDAQLKGGTGAGGTSYINETYFSNIEYIDGTELEWTYQQDPWNTTGNTVYVWDSGRNAGAKIKLAQYDTHTLTINYLDVNDNSVVANQHVSTHPYGEEYSVTSPDVAGYTIANVSLNDKIVSGTMPDQDVVIDVYYDYPRLLIHYRELGTEITLSEDHDERMKAGTAYSVDSPNVDEYEFYEDESKATPVAGNKLATDEEYTVYYVKKWQPTKHIVAVNGYAVSEEQCEAGVELKAGDIVTYEIRYENRRNVTRNETITDELPASLKYVDGSATNTDTQVLTVADRTLTWQIKAEPTSNGTVQFKAEVVETTDDIKTVDNWDRKDPLIKYTIEKSAEPANGSTVSFGQEIMYNIVVKNTGTTTVHNIVVIDPIPENTAFKWVNHSYSGEYNSEGNYTKFVIPELKVNGVAKLQFKVKVTKELEGDQKDEVINVAKYQNFNPGTTIPTDQEIIEKGKDTNKIIHPLVGIILSSLKTSNPDSGSQVERNQEITYRVKIANETPVYYVAAGIQPLEDDKKVGYREGTDYSYSYDVDASGIYRLTNISVNVENIDQIAIEAVSRMHINTDGVDKNIWNITNDTTHVFFTPKDAIKNGFPTKDQVVALLKSLSWTMDSIQLAQASGNTVSADNQHNGEMNNAVPNGYYVKQFKTKVYAEESSNKKAHVDFGSISQDYTGTKIFDFGSYVSMGGQKAHVYTYAGGDGNYKNVSAWITAYKTSADEKLIGIGMSKIFEVRYDADSDSLAKSTANIHITDEIPSYTTYVDGTAHLIRDGVEENISSNGTDFDIKYNFAGYYQLTNIGFDNVGRFNEVYVTYPTSLTVDGDNSGTLTKKGITTVSELKTYLSGLKFYGSPNTTGNIKIKLRWYNHKETQTVEGTFTEQQISNKNYGNGNAGNVTALIDGYYQLEAWGGQGGSAWGSSAYGGAGGYTKGTFWLTEGQTIYVVTGGRGWNNMGGTDDAHTPTNGGGCNTNQGSNGGGATSWTTTNRGWLKNYSNYRDEVLLVAGGGAAGQGNGAGGTGGGYQFGQGQNAGGSSAGGGGWSGGTAGRGGTNYIKSGALNTESKAGVNSNAYNGGYSAAAGYAKVTFMGTDANNLKAQTATKYKTDIVNEDEIAKETSTAIPQSNPSTFGACRFTTIEGKPSVECYANDIEGGKNLELVFKAKVDSTTPQGVSIENTGRYDSSFTKYTDFPGTKSKTSTNTVYHHTVIPTVTAEKSADPVSGSAITRGQDITYFIKLNNTSEGTANYIHVRDYIPKNAVYDGGYISDGGVYVEDGNYVEWVVKNIKGGESRTVQFTVKASDTLTAPQKIYNKALYELSLENPGEPGLIEKTPGKETNQTVHSILEDVMDKKPELSSNKDANPVNYSVVHRTDEIEYSLEFENTGEMVQSHLLVGDTIPEGTTFKEFKVYNGGTNSPNLEVDSYYSEKDDAAKWIVRNLVSGDKITLKFVVTVNKECMQNSIVNTAYYKGLNINENIDQNIVSDNHLDDKLNNSNDFDKTLLTEHTNDITHFLAQPIVTVVKSSNPETGTVVPRGSKITYTLSVSNTGKDVANYVNVQDFIPANTMYVADSAATEVDKDKAGTVKVDGSTKATQFVLYDLKPGETRTVKFSVKVNKDCQTGAFIDNVAYYENFELDHGKPGTDSFVEPTKETNKTRHTVELASDIVDTGGQGWSNMLVIGGGIVIVLAIVILILAKKHKDGQ